ncbi:MAG: exodeoxyribonuclease V subunit alpha [Deltaproteobacteria bacterium]|nr:MAG: exodeoxyribonuclease V subunit alpha [Deltaproteobacteria bacterium]
MTRHLYNDEFERMVDWFVERRILMDEDLYPVDLLARRAGEDRPEVLCAFAFCLRAARHGHAGLWLDERTVEMLETDFEGEEEKQALSQKFEEAGMGSWPEVLRESPLVSMVAFKNGTSPEDGYRPFVLLGEDAKPCGDGTPARLVQLKHYLAEEKVAEIISSLKKVQYGPQAEAKLDDWFVRLEQKTGKRLDEKQRQAVEAVLRRKLVVLTGGPGTGKTFTVGMILRAWFDFHRDEPDALRVALCTPTGKAADRMREALEGEDFPEGFAAFLENNRPGTIHRLLGARPGGGFRHGAENRLPHRLVVVDETSMVDLVLMRRLLEALSGDARLVLVGDADQLASVEVGCVFGDLVKGLGEGAGDDPVIRLSRMHRAEEGGKIADLVERICGFDGAHSEDEVLGFICSAGEKGDVVFDETETESELLERLSLPYEEKYLEACKKACESPGEESWGEMLRALGSYRVLAPLRRGKRGVERLNGEIARRLAGEFAASFGGASKKGWFDLSLRWHAGRPVMVTENRYDLGLFNGDVGVVVRYGEQNIVVFAASGENGPLRRFTPAQLPACETVFATTVHKAQGSEFDEVAVVLPSAESPLLTRELVYTAVTRAKKRLFLYSTKAVLRAALARRIRRASGLDRLVASAE